MNIFVVNRGSSSLKCSLYSFCQSGEMELRWEGVLDWKAPQDFPMMSITIPKKTYDPVQIHAQDLREVVQTLMDTLLQEDVLKSLQEIDVIGHRIVHGGRAFTQATRVDQNVKELIRELSLLAPLHNSSELEAIEVLEHLCPNIFQVVVFDTAFHRTLPDYVRIYPGPYSWVEQGIERYGFHGISYQYCSRKVQELLKGSRCCDKMVICHLGSGASLCAVDKGKSIDTTMGFTPLDGLMMDTRCGSIDPGIVLYLLKEKKLEEVSRELYHSSGLLGISGFSSDMRDILEKAQEPKAKLALEMYVHHLCSLIAAMAASLRGIDVLVFTGGIGENAAPLREQVAERLAFLGIEMSKQFNEDAHALVISPDHAKVCVVKLHTQEALEIARECYLLLRRGGLDDGRG